MKLWIEEVITQLPGVDTTIMPEQFSPRKDFETIICELPEVLRQILCLQHQLYEQRLDLFQVHEERFGRGHQHDPQQTECRDLLRVASCLESKRDLLLQTLDMELQHRFGEQLSHFELKRLCAGWLLVGWQKKDDPQSQDKNILVVSPGELREILVTSGLGIRDGRIR